VRVPGVPGKANLCTGPGRGTLDRGGPEGSYGEFLENTPGTPKKTGYPEKINQVSIKKLVGSIKKLVDSIKKLVDSIKKLTHSIKKLTHSIN
jgi:hypothetical protein